MKIQYLNGGLANQVFQYIFYRYAELSSNGNDVWLLDDSFFFFKNQHNGYELENVFGVKPNLLSRQFDKAAWDFFIQNRKNGIGTAQTMLNMGMSVQMVAEAENYKNDNPFHGKVFNIPCNGYYPEILKLPGEVIYYFGYWINKEWLNAYKDQILSELSFPALTDESNLSYASKIKNTCSVGVHIRRGDFVSLGWNMDSDFYLNATKKMVELHPDLTFFVFSDDIAWCREHADELGLSLAQDIVFVEGNLHGKNYIDLQLMTMCRGLILSNSSFSYLGALMNRNLEFWVNPVSFRKI